MTRKSDKPKVEPVRLEPNPDYRKARPSDTTVNGLDCCYQDASTILALRDHYQFFKVT
jgi:hypothetical protein